MQEASEAHMEAGRKEGIYKALRNIPIFIRLSGGNTEGGDQATLEEWRAAMELEWRMEEGGSPWQHGRLRRLGTISIHQHHLLKHAVHPLPLWRQHLSWRRFGRTSS